MSVWLDLIKTGDIDAVRDYIASGGDVNAKNENDWTPLMFAAAGGNPDIVHLAPTST